MGYDIAEYPPEAWNPTGEKKVIHIGSGLAEVYVHYTPTVEVIGDVAVSLTKISAQLKDQIPQFDTDWYAPIRQQISDDIASYDLSEGESFTIPGALNLIRKALSADGLLISDVGSHKMWIARNFPTYCPNGCLISNGLASMGFALPGAIAASLIDPNRQIVAAMGDGGFLMNVQELETAHRLGVGFTAVIFNDDDYGLISWKQRQSRGRSVSTKIGNPDFKRLAESFGITAYRPENKADLEAQLTQAIGSQELCLIEIPVNPDVNDQLVEKLDHFWQNKN